MQIRSKSWSNEVSSSHTFPNAPLTVGPRSANRVKLCSVGAPVAYAAPPRARFDRAAAAGAAEAAAPSAAADEPPRSAPVGASAISASCAAELLAAAGAPSAACISSACSRCWSLAFKPVRAGPPRVVETRSNPPCAGPPPSWERGQTPPCAGPQQCEHGRIRPLPRLGQNHGAVWAPTIPPCFNKAVLRSRILRMAKGKKAKRKPSRRPNAAMVLFHDVL